jgi:coproporphyrinogen III oxidase-like Fe-S oxidoreductase
MPVKPVKVHSSEIAQNTFVPSVGLVDTVDPTVAIALELKQSVPSLKDHPTPEQMKNTKIVAAWKKYLRQIQDAQNQHTRSIRDAQLAHQKAVRDAEYHLNTNSVKNASSMAHGMSSIGSIINVASRFQTRRETYNQNLQNAKMRYENTVEHSHQKLNDSVERANRTYEDVLFKVGLQ